MQDFTENLAGYQVFSKISLVNACHQFPVEPADIAKTALVTEFGLFEHMNMLFGLRKAAQTFQRAINDVTPGLDFVFAYLDNLLVASPSHTELEEHLRGLFARRDDYGLVSNPNTCELGVIKVKLLGHLLTP